jgi:hypothetical protein
MEEIVAAALGRAGAERDAYLDSACGSDTARSLMTGKDFSNETSSSE